MMRVFSILGLAVALAVLGSVFTAKSADAVIHEIVAAYCSGGDVGVIDEHGELLPPPLADFTGDGPTQGRVVAKPVIASGAVNTTTFEVTDMPNNKFEEGSSAFALDSSNVDHPSADHCPKNALP
jgi:hypothetical protein